MADAAWILVHSYDPEAQAVVLTALQEADISRVHPYVPQPGSWHETLGLQVEVHLVDGSLIHLTETFGALMDAIKAKPV